MSSRSSFHEIPGFKTHAAPSQPQLATAKADGASTIRFISRDDSQQLSLDKLAGLNKQKSSTGGFTNLLCANSGLSKNLTLKMVLDRQNLSLDQLQKLDKRVAKSANQSQIFKKAKKRAEMIKTDPWGNPYRHKVEPKKMILMQKQIGGGIGKDRSASEMRVREKMKSKNFRIKQRQVNERQAFLSDSSQNLYKLDNEKQFRKRLLEDANARNHESSEQILDSFKNASQQLFEETESEISEPEIMTEDQIIEQFRLQLDEADQARLEDASPIRQIRQKNVSKTRKNVNTSRD